MRACWLSPSFEQSSLPEFKELVRACVTKMLNHTARSAPTHTAQVHFMSAAACVHVGARDVWIRRSGSFIRTVTAVLVPVTRCTRDRYNCELSTRSEGCVVWGRQQTSCP